MLEKIVNTLCILGVAGMTLLLAVLWFTPPSL